MDKTIIEKVKELLFSEEEVVEQSFLDVKTSDGIVLRVSELAEGASLSIISEDGENVSGAAEYTLEDGTVVVTNDEGVITSVTDAPAEEAVEEVEEEMQEEVVEDEVNPLDERIGKLEERLEDILSKFSVMSEKVEEFSKQPAEDEVVVGKKEFKKANKYSALEALSKYRKNKK